MMVSPDQDYFITSSADAIIAKHPIPKDLQVVAQTDLQDMEQRVVEISDEDETPTPSLLSEGLRGPSASKDGTNPTTKQPWSHPLKVVNTKHAGQQGLDIRSDGRIFATAGWDSKARVYSCKTLKEVAVLEWHKVGCYAVAFPDMGAMEAPDGSSISTGEGNSNSQSQTVTAITQSRSLVKDRRIRQATTTHWLAAGAKDGKISLWDIY
jgi:WD40 repeat protein